MRVVVVSGGGTGIGRATALRFAADGDRVMLVGRRADVLEAAADEVRAAHPGAPPPVTVAADVAEPAGAREVARRVGDEAGHVDVLVAAAGGNVGITAADDAPADALDRVAWAWAGNVRLNTLTAVLLTEALRPLLAPGGRVVLLSSIAAYRGSGTGSYAGSKAALHPYAFDLAEPLGATGATVKVVAPGYVAGTGFFGDGISAERERTLVAQTATGRAGTPEDVAATVHWLASPGAAHVTAQVVQVNGGAERGR